MSPSWLGGRGRERPSSPSCSPGHGGYGPDDAQGGKRCTGGASAASRLPTPSRLPAPAPPSVRQVGRAWPVLQGSRCSRAAGSGLAGAPGRPGAAHSGGRLGAPPHGRGAGTTHLAEEGGPRGPPRPRADLALPAPLCASARPRRSARKRLFFLCIYFFFLLTTMKGLLKSLWEKCTEEVLSLFHGYFKAPGLLAHALRLS